MPTQEDLGIPEDGLEETPEQKAISDALKNMAKNVEDEKPKGEQAQNESEQDREKIGGEGKQIQIKNDFEKAVDKFEKELPKDFDKGTEPDYRRYIYVGLKQGASFSDIKELARGSIEEGEVRLLQAAEGELLLDEEGISRPDIGIVGEGDFFRELETEFNERLRIKIEEKRREPGFNFDVYKKVIEYIDSLDLPEEVSDYSPADEYKKKIEQVISPIVERLKDKLKNKEEREFPSQVKDGEFFEAHGMAKGAVSEQLFSLINLLKNGPDPNRPALATTTYDSESNPHAAGGAYKTGEFVLLGPKNKLMLDEGNKLNLNVETVFVNDNCMDIIPDLQEMFPNVRFVKRAEVEDFFNKYK